MQKSNKQVVLAATILMMMLITWISGYRLQVSGNGLVFERAHAETK